MRKFSTLTNGKCIEIKPFWPCPGTGVFEKFYRRAKRSRGESTCQLVESVCGHFYNEFDNRTDKQLLRFCKGDEKVFDAIVKYGKTHWCRGGECDANWKAFNSALEETIARYIDFEYPVGDEYSDESDEEDINSDAFNDRLASTFFNFHKHTKN